MPQNTTKLQVLLQLLHGCRWLLVVHHSFGNKSLNNLQKNTAITNRTIAKGQDSVALVGFQKYIQDCSYQLIRFVVSWHLSSSNWMIKRNKNVASLSFLQVWKHLCVQNFLSYPEVSCPSCGVNIPCKYSALRRREGYGRVLGRNKT